MGDSVAVEEELQRRSGGRCELCGATDGLTGYGVEPDGGGTADRSVFACAVCTAQLDGADLDDKHWFCLKDAAWSGVPAVQVVSVRLLRRLDGAAWAQDLLGQLYLSDEVQEWVDATGATGAGGTQSDDDAPTLDSNGTPLADGDSVTLIKDLDVKGAGFTAKRGTVVKNIRVIGDPENIEGRINKTMLVLKTKFLKKV